MSEVYLLPSTTYRPPSPSLGRGAGRSLNTIMEEEPDTSHKSRAAPVPHSSLAPPNEKIVQWLSPRSDRFPTPRGVNYMSAPFLPDSPSTASFDESNSAITTSSNAWNRISVSTDVTEFDDIYDVSDDEEDIRRKSTRTSSLKRQNSSRNTMNRRPLESPTTPRALPPLVIPTQRDDSNESWSGRPAFKRLLSPVPPTPTATVEMSPAVMSFMQSQHAFEVPTISAPPSLDGSLTSDQMAAMSAPPTPVIGAQEESVSTTQWSGVQLQPAALATLHALSRGEDTDDEYQPEPVIEVQERVPEMSQQIPRRFNAIPRPALRLATEQPQSLNGLTRLDIPSPSGFFSGLSPRSRRTWHMTTMSPVDLAPPTSTTAEQFYRLPWADSAPAVPPVPTLPPPPPRAVSDPIPPPPAPVERIVEINGTLSDGIPTARGISEQIIEARQALSDDPPTARRISPANPLKSPTIPMEPLSPREEVDATEIVVDYDPEYAKKQQQSALSNLDRTEMWLQAQKVYLGGMDVGEDNKSESEDEPETVEIHVDLEASAPSPKVKESEPETSESSPPQRKKTVRFSEAVIKADIPRSLPSKLIRQESAYYRAFQDSVIRSRSQDAFVHRQTRFEALQAQRVSLREAHRNQLLGKYQLSVVPQSARKRMSANVVRGDDVLIDDPEKLKREKEHEALCQMNMANWHVGATKALNGGRIFSEPIAKNLARMSRIGGAQSRARILDLGGQATCDWAWHCSVSYPNCKVYTVTTKAIRQLSNSNVRGPPNHRQVAIERLPRLPFPDKHFDLVSARELHTILKFIGENGEDEWESCLAECMRVLKPGGYLEFSVMDSDVMNAGPLGLAKSVEFGFALKTLGYDPNPTRMFLGRLNRAGFEGTRRAWTCLPMGAKCGPKRNVVRDSDGMERSLELEAIVSGSTEGAACVAGLAGGWGWERWLLRCEMEKVAGEGRLVADASDVRAAGKCLEGVHDVVEEGRRCGAGWRVLSGFARKPKQ
ncbi:hypothetical protein F5Y15DRAFT_207506 [Xylariaceae sp. FL0016]|nr:hypothetical protein F5Y15DRAFT_207506 [Xylariaceae sp. FL0016]